MKLKPSKRTTINRNVKRSTLKLLVQLAKQLDTDQGRVIDRAVEMLAVAETFGKEMLKPSKPVKM